MLHIRSHYRILSVRSSSIGARHPGPRRAGLIPRQLSRRRVTRRPVRVPCGRDVTITSPGFSSVGWLTARFPIRLLGRERRRTPIATSSKAGRPRATRAVARVFTLQMENTARKSKTKRHYWFLREKSLTDFGGEAGRSGPRFCPALSLSHLRDGIYTAVWPRPVKPIRFCSKRVQLK